MPNLTPQSTGMLSVGGPNSGVLNVSTTATGTGDNTDVTTLYEYTLPAYMLGRDGDSLRITVSIDLSGDSSIVFAVEVDGVSVPLVDFGTADIWVVELLITRTGESEQFMTAFSIGGAAQFSTHGTFTADGTLPIVLSFTGENADPIADSVVFRSAVVEFLPSVSS